MKARSKHDAKGRTGLPSGGNKPVDLTPLEPAESSADSPCIEIHSLRLDNVPGMDGQDTMGTTFSPGRKNFPRERRPLRQAGDVFKHIAALWQLLPNKSARIYSQANAETMRTLNTIERESSYLQMTAITLMCLTGIAGTLMLYWLSDVLVPLGMALFVYCMLAPMSDCIWHILKRSIIRGHARAKSRAMAAAVLTLFLAFGLSLLIFYALVCSITTLATQMADYWDYIERYQVLVNSTTAEEYNATLHKLGLSPEGTVVWIMSLPGVSEGLRAALSKRALAGVAADIAGTSAGMLTPFAVMFFVALYLLHFRGVAQGERDRGLLRDSAERGLSETLIFSIENRMAGYFKQKTVSSLAQGVLSSLTYRILDIPLWWHFGIIHFFANWIPIAGPVLACLVPLPVALLVCDCIISPLIALAIPITVHLLISNIFEQWLMKELLPPVQMIAALVFWFRLWGLGGLVLAVPLSAALKMLIMNDRRDAPDTSVMTPLTTPAMSLSFSSAQQFAAPPLLERALASAGMDFPRECTQPVSVPTEH
eukprot:TRINITY_DN6924_c0_g2_i1.p1 TRINITY_DN6924_c0_g2~~TRINITY_DN6924_c0_g2_i1.p1  ORF type:complete len:562 (+),score=163.80 TRINITY_DN6924_c0_g2_i1:75-1688(+)